MENTCSFSSLVLSPNSKFAMKVRVDNGYLLESEYVPQPPEVARKEMAQFEAVDATVSGLDDVHNIPGAENLLQQIVAELNCYWRNPQHQFTLPLEIDKLAGSVFQKSVWRQLLKIPVGSSKTYGELAEQLQTSPRAIGNACSANELPLFIPCHRIVGKKNLGGFAHQRNGVMLEIKACLLQHEGAI